MVKLVPKYSHVSLREETLMKRCHSEGMGVRKISSLTGRSLDTVSKHIFKKHSGAPGGMHDTSDGRQGLMSTIR